MSALGFLEADAAVAAINARIASMVARRDAGKPPSLRFKMQEDLVKKVQGKLEAARSKLEVDRDAVKDAQDVVTSHFADMVNLERDLAEASVRKSEVPNRYQL